MRKKFVIGLTALVMGVSGCSQIFGDNGLAPYALDRMQRDVEAYKQQEQCDALLSQAKRVAKDNNDTRMYRYLQDRRWCSANTVDDDIDRLKIYIRRHE